MRKLVTQFKAIFALINCSFEKFKPPPPTFNGLKTNQPPPPGGGLNRGFTVCLQITGSRHLIKIHCKDVSSLTNLSSQIWLGMIPASLEPSVLLAWNNTKTTHSIQVFVTFPNHRRICSNSSIGNRVVSPTSPSANIPFVKVLCRSAKKRNAPCACVYFVLSAMIQKSAIRMYIPRSFSHSSGESNLGTDPTRTRNDFRS